MPHLPLQARATHAWGGQEWRLSSLLNPHLILLHSLAFSTIATIVHVVSRFKPVPPLLRCAWGGKSGGCRVCSTPISFSSIAWHSVLLPPSYTSFPTSSPCHPYSAMLEEGESGGCRVCSTPILFSSIAWHSLLSPPSYMSSPTSSSCYPYSAMLEEGETHFILWLAEVPMVQSTKMTRPA